MCNIGTCMHAKGLQHVLSPCLSCLSCVGSLGLGMYWLPEQGPVSQRAVFYDVLTMYLTKFKNIHTYVSRKMVLNYK